MVGKDVLFLDFRCVQLRGEESRDLGMSQLGAPGEELHALASDAPGFICGSNQGIYHEVMTSGTWELVVPDDPRNIQVGQGLDFHQSTRLRISPSCLEWRRTAEDTKVETGLVPLELRPYPENSLSDPLSGKLASATPPRKVDSSKPAIRTGLCRYSGENWVSPVCIGEPLQLLASSSILLFFFLILMLYMEVLPNGRAPFFGLTDYINHALTGPFVVKRR